MKYTLILFSISLLFISCDKNASVEGFVLAEHYETPFQNAEVVVRASHHGNSAEGIASTVTDANGYFKIEYKRRLFGYTYIIDVETKHGLEKLTKGISDRKTQLTCHLRPKTIVNLKVKNNLPYDIFFSGMIKTRAYSDTLLKGASIINGFGESPISWTYLKKNTWHTDTDTILVSVKTDTLIHLIEIN